MRWESLEGGHDSSSISVAAKIEGGSGDCTGNSRESCFFPASYTHAWAEFKSGISQNMCLANISLDKTK